MRAARRMWAKIMRERFGAKNPRSLWLRFHTQTAGCSLAASITGADVRLLRERFPGLPVVTYVNTSADVKAESDICCTSANAVQLAQKLEAKEIIFVPDQYLGHYVSTKTGKPMILWPGYCPTHARIQAADIERMRKAYPRAEVMVHPECNPEVIDMADEVFSTGQMVKFVRETDRTKIIVGTEEGMIHKLRSVAPGLEYILPSKALICPNMKKTTLEKVYASLVSEEHRVTVGADLREKSLGCLRRMLELSG